MNYKQLLLKYINHVGLSEGTTFLSNGHRNEWEDSVDFDDEEWAELQKLDAVDWKMFIGHSCSCHMRTQGPCDVCKTLGCEVFDFNEVALFDPPQADIPVKFEVGVDRGSLFIHNHDEPIFTLPEPVKFIPTEDEKEDVQFYNNAFEAMDEPFEPKTPCRQFETRPCVELSEDESQRFRVEACKPGECVRFPSRDEKE